MRLVESLRQSQEKLELMNAQFKGRVESTFRHWPEVINKKVATVRNMSMPWTHYLHLFDTDSANDETGLLLQCEASAAVYRRLKQQLGEETYIGDWLTIEQDSINQFAEVTGDNQWIHTDQSRATNESPFKTTIAHGFLTLSLIPFLTDSVDASKTPYPEARMVVNAGMNKVVFPAPVKVGKRIRARTRITKLEPLKRGLELVREVTIEVENSKRSACVAEMVLRLYF